MTDPFIGKKLGNYEITELIGKGGMAGVYKANQPSMNRTVAIKIMAQQFSEDDLFIQRFKNEASLIAHLEHAHILPVYDFGEEEGTLYIVMRYLPAGTLADRIKEGGMSLKDAVPIFVQVARALDYAHSQGVIHRDLKPGNILIDHQGNSFLSDFGIAKSVEDTQRLTGTGGVVGTPTYMSPEQGLGETVDSRSDIYALGVMLFEMTTGKVPFDADNAMALMLKHINEPPPLPSALNPSIPPQVESVITRALEKAPNARFATAGEMADMLENAYAVASGQTPPHAQVLGAAAAGTIPLAAAPGGAATMPAPVAGRAQPATPTPQPAVGAAVTPPLTPMVSTEVPYPTPYPPAVPVVEPPDYTINNISAWLVEKTIIGTWLQGLALSVATFIALSWLTPAGTVENVILAVIPGLFLYSLLSAPIPGGLVALGLIFIPLLAHAPGLAAIWLVMIVIAGAQMTSREMMLTVVTMVGAGTPLSWLIPLAAPWWMSKHRVSLGVAMGVIFGSVFTLMLGWPGLGGLLPHAPDPDLVKAVLLPGHQFDTSYRGLLDAKVWETWFADPTLVLDNLRATFSLLWDLFVQIKGLPLIMAAAWAGASLITVYNRRGASPVQRGVGIAVGVIVLIIGHIFHGWAGVEPPTTLELVVGFFMGPVAVLLTQWPIQAPPLPRKKKVEAAPQE